MLKSEKQRHFVIGYQHVDVDEGVHATRNGNSVVGSVSPARVSYDLVRYLHEAILFEVP